MIILTFVLTIFFFRLLYITLLRDPVQRYLSEWRHVQRGATWLAANLRCNGRSATLEEVPFCFTGIANPFYVHPVLYNYETIVLYKSKLQIEHILYIAKYQL